MTTRHRWGGGSSRAWCSCACRNSHGQTPLLMSPVRINRPRAQPCQAANATISLAQPGFWYCVITSVALR